jgi:ferritin
MISKKMEKALNEQINKEFYSAYLYLAMAAQCENLGLKGFGNWFKVQYTEELTHALKFFDYVSEQGGRVELASIKQPPVDFKSPLAMFEQSHKHEQYVTQSIHGLVDLAIKEGDHATHSMLTWFVDEQVEEEANALEIVTKLKMIGPSGSGVLYLDGKLAKRKAGGGEEA